MSARFIGLLHRSWILVFVSLFLFPMLFHAAPQGTNYHLIRTISLGGEGTWDQFTLDPDAKRIYIPRNSHIMVLDEVSGKIVGDIPNLDGLHSVQVAPEFNRGFATTNGGGASTITIFDLKTLQVTSTLPSTGKATDAAMYDPVTKRVFVNNATGNNVTAVDTSTGQVVGTVPLNARPEAAVPDGKGSMFVDILDKNQIMEYDAKTLTVKNTWPTAPCERPIGLSMDRAHRRLFVGCQPNATSGIMVIINADNGQVVASMPIGIGSDGVAYDAGTGDLFVTCRDGGDGKNGVVHVFHEDSPDKYTKIADVQTMYGARMLALDAKTHHIFTIGTEQNDPVPATADNPNPRPKPVLSTFAVQEVGK